MATLGNIYDQAEKEEDLLLPEGGEGFGDIFNGISFDIHEQVVGALGGDVIDSLMLGGSTALILAIVKGVRHAADEGVFHKGQFTFDNFLKGFGGSSLKSLGIGTLGLAATLAVGPHAIVASVALNIGLQIMDVLKRGAGERTVEMGKDILTPKSIMKSVRNNIGTILKAAGFTLAAAAPFGWAAGAAVGGGYAAYKVYEKRHLMKKLTPAEQKGVTLIDDCLSNYPSYTDEQKEKFHGFIDSWFPGCPSRLIQDGRITTANQLISKMMELTAKYHFIENNEEGEYKKLAQDPYRPPETVGKESIDAESFKNRLEKFGKLKGDDINNFITDTASTVPFSKLLKDKQFKSEITNTTSPTHWCLSKPCSDQYFYFNSPVHPLRKEAFSNTNFVEYLKSKIKTEQKNDIDVKIFSSAKGLTELFNTRTDEERLDDIIRYGNFPISTTDFALIPGALPTRGSLSPKDYYTTKLTPIQQDEFCTKYIKKYGVRTPADYKKYLNISEILIGLDATTKDKVRKDSINAFKDNDWDILSSSDLQALGILESSTHWSEVLEAFQGTSDFQDYLNKYIDADIISKHKTRIGAPTAIVFPSGQTDFSNLNGQISKYLIDEEVGDREHKNVKDDLEEIGNLFSGIQGFKDTMRDIFKFFKK